MPLGNLVLFKILKPVCNIRLNLRHVNTTNDKILDNIIFNYHINNKLIMTNISINLPKSIIEYIKNQVRMGNYANKSQFVVKALKNFRENEAIESIRRAERDIKEGRVYYGDLDDLAKKFRNN